MTDTNDIATTEKVHCPECGTTAWEDSIEDAIEVQERHDAKRHDGERVTKINGIIPPEFTELEIEQMQENLEAAEVFEDAE